MSGLSAVAIKGVTLRKRTVGSAKNKEIRVEVVVHTCDGEAWIAMSEPLWSFDSGIVDTHVTALGITSRPSRICPVIGKKAMQKFEDEQIKAGNMKPRNEWGQPDKPRKKTRGK